MKLTDDSNLEGVGNTSTRRESLQLWRLRFITQTRARQGRQLRHTACVHEYCWPRGHAGGLGLVAGIHGRSWRCDSEVKSTYCFCRRHGFSALTYSVWRLTPTYLPVTPALEGLTPPFFWTQRALSVRVHISPQYTIKN